MAYAAQGTLFGFTNNPHAKTLWDKSRTKPRTTKDQDAHDRDYAPLIKDQRYKREFDVRQANLERAKRDLEIEADEEMPKFEKLDAELARRKKMIADSDALLKGCKKKIDEFVEYREKDDEKCNALRQAIIDKLTKVFPQLREHMMKVEWMIQSDVHRLIKERNEIKLENNELRTAAGKSLGSEKLSEQLEKYLNQRSEKMEGEEKLASEQLITKNQELLVIRAQFEQAEKQWQALKENLESSCRKLEEKSEQLYRENRTHVADMRDRKRDLESANTQKNEAEQRREELQEELNGTKLALENVEGNCDYEKQRADNLQEQNGHLNGDLGLLQNQIDNLIQQLADASRPQVAGLELRERQEFNMLKVEASKYNSWRQNFISKHQQLQVDLDSANRQLGEKDETIRNLQEQLGKAKATNTLNAEKIVRMRTREGDLMMQVDSAGDETFVLENKVHDLEEQIDDLQGRYDVLETAEEVVRGNYDWAMKSLRNYEEQLDESGVRNDELKTQNEDLSKALGQRTTEWEEIKTQSDDLSKALRQTTIEWEELKRTSENDKAQADRVINSAEQAKQKVDMELGDANILIEHLEQEKADIDQQLSEANKSLRELGEEKSMLDAQLQAGQQSFKRLEQSKKDVDQQLEKIKASAKEEEEEFGRQLNRAMQSLQQLEESKKGVDHQLDEVKAFAQEEREDFERQLGEARQSIDGLEHSKKDLDQKLKDVTASAREEKEMSERQLGEARQSFERLEQSKKETDQQLEKVTTSAKEEKAESDRKLGEAKKSIDRLEHLKRNLDERLDQANNAAEKAKEDFERDFMAANDSIEDLEKKKKSLDGQIAELDREKTNLHDAAEKILADLNKERNEHSRTASSLQMVGRENENSWEERNKLTGQVKELEKTKKSLESRVVELEGEKTELHDSAQRNMADLSKTQVEYKKLLSANQMIGPQNDKLWKENRKIKGQVTALESTITTMVQMDVYDQLKISADETLMAHANCDSKITQLESTIDDMFTLEAVDTIKADIQAKFNALKEDHDKCEPRIAQLESKISGMITQKTVDGILADAQAVIDRMVDPDVYNKLEKDSEDTIGDLHWRLGMSVDKEIHDKLIHDTNATITDLKSRIGRMVLKEEANRQIEGVRLELENLRVEMVTRDVYDEIKSSAEATTAAHANCHTLVAQLQSTIDNMITQETYDKLKSSAEATSAAHANCHTSMAQLQSTIENMVTQETYDELKSSAEAMSAAHANCEISIADLGRTNGTKQTRITELETNIRGMVSRDELTQLRNSLNALQAEHSQCAGRLANSVNRTPQTPSRDLGSMLAGVGQHFNTPDQGFGMSRRPSADNGFDMSRRPSADSGFGGTALGFDVSRRSSASDGMAFGGPHGTGMSRSSSSSSQSFNPPQQFSSVLRPSDNMRMAGQMGQGFDMPRQSSGTPQRFEPSMQSPGFGPPLHQQRPFGGFNQQGPPASPSPSGQPQSAGQQQYGQQQYPPWQQQSLQQRQPAQRQQTPQQQQAPQPQQPAGQLGAPHLRPYVFLISGFLEGGLQTRDALPELYTQMDKQITFWLGQDPKKGQWSSHTTSSETRCVDTRRTVISKEKAPPANDPTGNVACQRCIKKKQLCVLVGKIGGPVIVPLPLADRAPGADSSRAGYYMKQ